MANNLRRWFSLTEGIVGCGQQRQVCLRVRPCLRSFSIEVINSCILYA